MAHIDFAIAFVVVFTMIAYSVFIVSGSVSKDFEHFSLVEIQESQDSLSKQLFKTSDNKSLISNFKKIEVSLQEIGGYQHTESIEMSIRPIMDKVHVYNQTIHEVPSSVSSDGNYTNISFDLEFSASQTNYISIFYSGNETEEIIYNSNANDTNVTARILSERDVAVLSQERCNILKGLDYDAARNIFGFNHRFRIDNYCVYGEEPPIAANIIVKSVPMLVEEIDGTIHPEQVTLKVW